MRIDQSRAGSSVERSRSTWEDDMTNESKDKITIELVGDVDRREFFGAAAKFGVTTAFVAAAAGTLGSSRGARPDGAGREGAAERGHAHDDHRHRLPHRNHPLLSDHAVEPEGEHPESDQRPSLRQARGPPGNWASAPSSPRRFSRARFRRRSIRCRTFAPFRARGRHDQPALLVRRETSASSTW